MNTARRIPMCRSSILFLALTVGLAVLFASSGVSLAVPKDPIYNTCMCACMAPVGQGFGGILTGIRNTAGLPCEAYNNKTCNEESADGVMTTGNTKFCQGDKSGGTKVILAPSTGQNAPVLQQTPTTPGGMRAPTTGTILRRGIEGEQPAEPSPGSPTSPDQPSETKPQ
jgi:hypothetical protein